MDITVILCTYNRAQSLRKALDSVALSKLPESAEWEVLVVDNRSTDTTPTVVKEVSGLYPGRFRYFFEPKSGKSHALNAGIGAARGSILAFMDDDVIVEADWLHNLTSGLRGDKWVGAGGRIFPVWKSSPPDWLPIEDRYGLAPLVMFDLGPEAGPLFESPFGTNMAFRKDVFEKYGLFRTDLGPMPKGEIRGEDSEFAQRLLNAGEPLRYEPSAVVHHEVPEKRLRKDFFLAFWFDKGRTDIRTFGPPAKGWNIAGVPFDVYSRLATWTVRWLLTFAPRRRFSAKTKMWGRMGEIIECRRLSKAEKRTNALGVTEKKNA
jgi:glucosyl-dolichyl phosphate glucuronosyltransferase